MCVVRLIFVCSWYTMLIIKIYKIHENGQKWIETCSDGKYTEINILITI
jgi:hypothetical protein